MAGEPIFGVMLLRGGSTYFKRYNDLPTAENRTWVEMHAAKLSGTKDGLALAIKRVADDEPGRAVAMGMVCAHAIGSARGQPIDPFRPNTFFVAEVIEEHEPKSITLRVYQIPLQDQAQAREMILSGEAQPVAVHGPVLGEQVVRP